MTSATTHDTRDAAPAARVTPSPWVALGVFVAYVLVVNGLQYASGVPYSAFFASAGNAMRSAVASLAVGCVLLAGFIAWSRWDGLWRDVPRLRMTPLMWVAPALMAALLLVRFALKLAGGGIPVDLAGAILLAGVGVGFAEEMLFRGVVLRALRTGGRSEAAAMLLSSLWFGGMHLTNALVGSPLYVAALQAFVAAISGATLYQFRRATGWIGAGMIAHGLWDVSVFLPGGSQLFDGVALGLAVLAGLVSASAVLVHDRRRSA